MKYSRFTILLLLVMMVTACSSAPATSPSQVSSTPTSIVRENLAQTRSEPVNVITNRYNHQRTGANLKETILNTTNVNVDEFGLLFTREVVGDIYAQPLYVQNVEIPEKGTRSVVYVATMHNRVYAFDADDPAESAPLWEVDLGVPFTQNVLADIYGGEVGVLSTPVIDPETQTIYLVSRTWEEKAVYKLNALDIRTGEARPGSPTVIELSVPGTGLNNVDGVVSLDSYNQLQRPGLLLLNGFVYVAFGSNNDFGQWFGWLAAYNAETLKLDAAFNVAPNGYFGGIWMAGAAIATDDEFLYLATANGVNTVAGGGQDYALSILKMKHTPGAFEVADYYTPANYEELDNGDSGIGSTGVVLIPATNTMIAGSKDSNLYVVDRTNLGKFDAETDTSLQIFSAGQGRMYVTPVYWDSGPGSQATAYLWNENDKIRAYHYDAATQTFSDQPTSVSGLGAVGMPVGSLTLSANGVQEGTGILWATLAPRADKNADRSGALVALDATNLTRVLWHSDMDKERDALGMVSKFGFVTVVNGKVYVPTFSNRLNVYGLLPPAS